MNNSKDSSKIALDDLSLEDVAGGTIVDEGDGMRYWLVRQDGTVIAPVPGRE